MDAGAAKAAMAMTALRASAMAAATAFSAFSAAGLMSFQRFAEFESLQKALESVEGSADGAVEAIKALKEIAKAPGLGFQEAVKGYMMLRNQGVSGPGAERMVGEFGNANARAGGGKAELERILLAISQIAGQRYLQGDELRQLTEAGVPASRIIRERFGTSDTEQLKKQGITSERILTELLDELEKMPRVAGGAKNSIENLQDAINFAFITTGAAIASSGLTDFLTEFGNEVQKLTEAGFFDGLAAAFEGIGGKSITAKGAVVAMAASLQTATFMVAAFADKIGYLIDKLGPVLQIGMASSPVGAIVLEGMKRWSKALDAQTAINERTLKQALDRKESQKGAPLMENPAAEELADDSKKQTALLDRIAVANEAQLDLQRIIFGASGVKGRAFQPIELSGVNRRGGGWESKIIDAVREAAGEIAAQNVAAFSRSQSPFAVGR